MIKKIAVWVLTFLQKADIELHWRGGEQDEFRVIIRYNDRILIDRTLDVIRK